MTKEEVMTLCSALALGQDLPGIFDREPFKNPGKARNAIALAFGMAKHPELALFIGPHRRPFGNLKVLPTAGVLEELEREQEQELEQEQEPDRLQNT